MDALEDCLLRARARVLDFALRERGGRGDLVIALGRLNMALVLLRELEAKLDLARWKREEGRGQ